ncbi:MAG: DUF177 domain-containing protein [Pseudomonadota bacterium]
MIIKVRDINNEGLNLQFQEQATIFPTLAEMEEAGECKFIAPLVVHLRVISINSMIEVEGSVETKVKLTCDRCLTEFEFILSEKFTLTYANESNIANGIENSDEIELKAEDLGIIPFHGTEIDFSDAIQEQVIMSFPAQALCKEDCKGLCPQCGHNRNLEDCDCKNKDLSNPFAALKKICLFFMHT